MDMKPIFGGSQDINEIENDKIHLVITSAPYSTFPFLSKEEIIELNVTICNAKML